MIVKFAVVVLEILLIANVLGVPLASARTTYAPARRGTPSSDSIPNETLQAGPAVDVYFDPADLENPDDPKRLYFDLVVVINKAFYAQTIDVYRNGEHLQLMGKNVLTARVSTGRETPEYADKDNPKAPTHDYFSETPTGYFNVQRLDIDHQSTTWTDSFMPWAVFFNGGIATHRSPHEDLSANPPVIDRNIGHRASGGCIRLHEHVAKNIFWWVRLTGGPLSELEYSRAMEDGEPDYHGYAHDERQVVPVINRDGSLNLDKDGQVIAQYGYKTLYIVEDVPPEGKPNPSPARVLPRSRTTASWSRLRVTARRPRVIPWATSSAAGLINNDNDRV